jgi:hypothetical protein
MAFNRFIAIDWSGAQNPAHYRQKIQIAVAQRAGAPQLWQADISWTRQQVLGAVRDLLAEDAASLIGFDFSFAPPYSLTNGYFSGAIKSLNAKELWEYIEFICEGEPDLSAHPFIARYQAHFYTGKACGPKAPYLQLRQCEQIFNAHGGGKPSSIFDCVGAAQVAKASFAGMRLLNQLKPHTAIWPFDSKPAQGACIVEIYCRAFIQLAGLSGRKIRDLNALNAALHALESPPIEHLAAFSDDKSDALVAAAALRYLAHRPDYWQPAGLTEQIAQCEGWTFGVK